MDVPAGVTQEEGHTGFLVHLLSAVRAITFIVHTEIGPMTNDKYYQYLYYQHYFVIFCYLLLYTKATEIA